VSEFSLQSFWFGLRQRIGRKFAKDMGILTISNVASATLGLLQGILVARWLGPEKFGVAALVMSYPAMLFAFFDARTNAATIKFLSEFKEKGEIPKALAVCKLGYGVDLAVALLTLIAVMATAGWAQDRIVHAPGMAPLMIAYSLAFLPEAFAGTSRAMLSVLGRFDTIAWSGLLSTGVRVAAVCGFVLAGWEVAGVIWGNVLGKLALAGLCCLPATSKARKEWGAFWFWAEWKNLSGLWKGIFRFIIYTDLSQLLGMFSRQMDIVILGYFRGPEEAGYYRLARSLARGAGYLVHSLQTVAYPKLARLAAGVREVAFRRSVRQLALQAGAPLAGLALIPIPFMPVLVPALVGDAFEPSVIAAQALLVGSAFWLAFFWLRPTFMALGEVKAWFQMGTMTVAVRVGGMVLTSYLWGYVGLALWVMATRALGHVGAACWLFRRGFGRI